MMPRRTIPDNLANFTTPCCYSLFHPWLITFKTEKYSYGKLLSYANEIFFFNSLPATLSNFFSKRMCV